MSLLAPSGFVGSELDVDVVVVGAVVVVVEVVGAVGVVVVGAAVVVAVVLDVIGAVVVGAVTVLVDSSLSPHPATAIAAAAKAEAQRTRSGARAGIRSRRLWLPGAGRSAGSR